MGVIDEIKSLFRGASDVGDKFDKFNTRSIARGAAEQSFIFPMIVDDNIPVNMASVWSQNMDRVCASWAQIYLSNEGVIDLNYIKNPRQFIAKYQPKGFLEEAEDTYDAYACDPELSRNLYGSDESLFVEEYGDITRMVYVGPGKPTADVRQAVRHGMEPQLSLYNHKSIGSCYMEPRIFVEAPAEDIIAGAVQNGVDSQRMRDNAAMLRAKDIRPPKLSDADVKKINDMQPYVLDLKLLATKGDSSFSDWITFSVGVKSHLHLADSAVLYANLVDVLRNRKPLFNFIRWTTGEISLMKDIILHLDDINFDIANKGDRTGRMFSRLKELRKKKLNVGTFGVNRFIPFATIAISSNTYHDIKTECGYDLKNITFAKKLMNELFLMCFCVMDEATHTYDILVDGQSDFQTYSLETLEREVTMKSSKLSKELTRMLGAT